MRRRQALGVPALAVLGAAVGSLATPCVRAQTAAPPDGRREWFVFLETGRSAPNTTPEEKARLAEMQRGHIDNFKRLHADKKLLAAGPMRDPARVKRGIVIVRADTAAEVQGYFGPDDYVRDGFLLANATPCVARRALNSEGIDPEGIEEVRIVIVPADSGEAAARGALLQSLLAAGTVGAWYTLDGGAVAEVLFARTTDTAALQAALAPLPGAMVWPQWLGKGVVPQAGR
jgi:uncharacterized protein YciI